MRRQSLRWLLPPNSDRWIGLNSSVEVAHVWPDGIVGNQVEQWNWMLLADRRGGHVPGTGDDDRDLYAAQDCASRMYFEGPN